MKNEIRVLLFYKYTDINDSNCLRETVLKACEDSGVRGRILVASEGINGSVSGSKTETEKFKLKLKQLDGYGFEDLIFKEDIGVSHPFNKLKVVVKENIINLGEDLDWKEKKGEKISPAELLELYENKEDILVLDTRNEYEYRVGRLKDAVSLGINTFREFPKAALEKLKGKEDKKIVMYCTGGIRCEKASAYLLKNGFKDISQLDGGILSLGKEFPETIWQGKCFVFDKRLISKVNSTDEIIGSCEICKIGCDLYRNCKNNICDKFCIVCLDCEKAFGSCCSKDCFKKIQENQKLVQMGSS